MAAAAPAGAASLSVVAGRVEVTGTFPGFEGETRQIVGPPRGKRVAVAEPYAAASALERPPVGLPGTSWRGSSGRRTSWWTAVRKAIAGTTRAPCPGRAMSDEGRRRLLAVVVNRHQSFNLGLVIFCGRLKRSFPCLLRLRTDLFWRLEEGDHAMVGDAWVNPFANLRQLALVATAPGELVDGLARIEAEANEIWQSLRLTVEHEAAMVAFAISKLATYALDYEGQPHDQRIILGAIEALIGIEGVRCADRAWRRATTAQGAPVVQPPVRTLSPRPAAGGVTGRAPRSFW